MSVDEAFEKWWQDYMKPPPNQLLTERQAEAQKITKEIARRAFTAAIHCEEDIEFEA